MPIYEFQCLKCNKKLEKILSISESNKKIKCDCGTDLQRVVSAPSFRLDGKGWYETDFKTGNKKNLVQSKEPNQKKQDQIKKPIKKDQPKSDT